MNLTNFKNNLKLSGSLRQPKLAKINKSVTLPDNNKRLKTRLSTTICSTQIQDDSTNATDSPLRACIIRMSESCIFVEVCVFIRLIIEVSTSIAHYI